MHLALAIDGRGVLDYDRESMADAAANARGIQRVSGSLVGAVAQIEENDQMQLFAEFLLAGECAARIALV
jgi:hypothetical protein